MPRFRFLAGLVSGVLLCAGLLAVTRVARSDEDPVKEAFQKWTEFATPGPRHQELARFVGTWDVEVSLAGGLQGGKAVRGTAEFSLSMNGRWLEQRVRGEALLGQPYEAFGLLGWDNFKKKYVSAWVDSTSTALTYAEGLPQDAKGDVRVLWGTADNFQTGTTGNVVKLVTRVVDASRFVMEVWDAGTTESGRLHGTFAYTRKNR
jgi:hypothetical protein